MPVSGGRETSPPHLVLLHVPRCGGTALHEAFAPRFPEERICPERMNRLETLPPEEIAGYWLFSGHYRFEHLDLVPRPRLAVTVLREPRERLVSLYHHWRRHWPEISQGSTGLRLAQGLSLVEFLRSGVIDVVETFDNAMARQLAGDCRARAPGQYTRWAWEDTQPVEEGAIVAAACRNLESLDVVGFPESLDALHAHVSHRMGWPPPAALPWRNGTGQAAWGLHPVEWEAPSPEAMQELDRLTRLDQVVWQHAKALAAGRPLLLCGAPG